MASTPRTYKSRHSGLKRALLGLKLGGCHVYPLGKNTAHQIQAIIHHFAGGGAYRSLKKGNKLFIVRVE